MICATFLSCTINFLIIYMFSFSSGSPVLLGETKMNIEYPNFYDCVSDGYIRSYSSIMKLGPDQVIKDKIKITFKCEELNGIGS